MQIADEIENLFSCYGGAAYLGEAVSQLEHALQAAFLADQAAAPPELVIAALLHDIGHLLHGLPEAIAEEGIDARHEDLGAAWLDAHFGPAVTEPIRLHVAAKRYLCAVDLDYRRALSPASEISLKLQGGPADPAQIRDFEANPHSTAAVQLRRWDDAAKVPGLPVPGVERYRERLHFFARS
jgi:phosphonate degradation associated HDIG domain protein